MLGISKNYSNHIFKTFNKTYITYSASSSFWLYLAMDWVQRLINVGMFSSATILTISLFRALYSRDSIFIATSFRYNVYFLRENSIGINPHFFFMGENPNTDMDLKKFYEVMKLFSKIFFQCCKGVDAVRKKSKWKVMKMYRENFLYSSSVCCHYNDTLVHLPAKLSKYIPTSIWIFAPKFNCRNLQFCLGRFKITFLK